MRENKGSTKARGGFYFNTTTWELVTLNGKEGVLPGEETTRFVRVPALLLVAGAPVLGGAYVMFLPLVGFVLLFRHLGKSLVEKVAAATPAAAVKAS